MERGLALSYKTFSGFNFENQPFGALPARSRPRKEPGVACPRPGGEPDIELPHLETCPGAACSAHFSAGTVMRRISRISTDDPKRLPSRRWAVALGNNATNLFEDD